MLLGVHVLFLCITTSVIALNETEFLLFLEEYGYVNSTNNIIDLDSVVRDFQERYNLPVDGRLNNKTQELLNRPRCAYPENNYRVQSQWGKSDIYWYFPRANGTVRAIVKKAFDMWQNVSILNFTETRNPSLIKPDITISFGRRTHRFRADCQGSRVCSQAFDGPGKILAHGYFPQMDNRCIELHIDSEENWDFYEGGDTNFLMVIAHEVGHNLGLDHSDSENAIMYPWYQGITQLPSSDDILGVEALYGRKYRYAPIPPEVTSSATTSSSTSTTTFKPTIEEPQHINLCTIKIPDFMFLASGSKFPNYKLYIGYNQLLWKLDLNDMRIPRAELLIDYIPQQIRNSTISHIYQNSAGHLVALTERGESIEASFPDLNFLKYNNLRTPTNSHIDTIFQTNSGKTFVFYDGTRFIELSGNYVSDRGEIKDIFPGLPSQITSAFRYTDGYIYFFQNTTFYKFSEYTNKIIEAGQFNWNLFGIPCPDDGMLNQLRNMLSKIIVLYE